MSANQLPSNGALRDVAAKYRAAFPRAAERGLIFAAGSVFALQVAEPIAWYLVPLGFLMIATPAVVGALLIGVRVTLRAKWSGSRTIVTAEFPE